MKSVRVFLAIGGGAAAQQQIFPLLHLLLECYLLPRGRDLIGDVFIEQMLVGAGNGFRRRKRNPELAAPTTMLSVSIAQILDTIVQLRMKRLL